MYPITRIVKTYITAHNAEKLTYKDSAKTSFIVRPWDLDFYREVNNGRILTLCDLGRYDLAIRTGLDELIRKKNWGLVVAGTTIQYRKRMRLFNKISIHTKLLGCDQRWFYIGQTMWHKQQPCTSAVLRTGITSRGKLVTPDIVFSALDLDATEFVVPSWVKTWIQGDQQHPWPPVNEHN